MKAVCHCIWDQRGVCGIAICAAVILLAGACGQSSGPDGLLDEAATHPEISDSQNQWPGLPADGIQPWERLDGQGYVQPASRAASALDGQTEFIPGALRFDDGGSVLESGDALHLSSGSPGGAEVSFALYRLSLQGEEPGLITTDINLGLQSDGKLSRYFIGLSNYSSGNWEWFGPLSDGQGLISTASLAGKAQLHSPLGNTFIAVLAFGGAEFDIVGIGAALTDPADTTPPPAPQGLAVTAVNAGAELQWFPVVAADLAGYRVYWNKSPFDSPDDNQVKSGELLEGLTNHLLILPERVSYHYAVSAVDLSGNESPLSEVIEALPAGGSAPVIGISLSAASSQRNGGVQLSVEADPGLLLDYDLDGDGSFELTASASRSELVDTAQLGVIRPLVRATDGGTAVARGSVSLLVNGNSRPVALGTATPQSGAAPLDVSFTGLGEDIDGTIVGGGWDFDGDGIFDAFDDTDIVHVLSEQHIYATEGLFNAKLQVIDDQGAWDVDTLSIFVGSATGNPPVADLLPASSNGNVPLTVNFNASGSTTGGDPGDSIVEYAWDFDGDGNFDGFGSDPTISHTYTSPGAFTAKLRITDEGGNQATDTATVNATVAGNNAPFVDPLPKFASGIVPLTVDFDATENDAGGDPGDSVVSFEWDWDGNGAYDSNSDTPLVSYTYTDPGHYAPRVRVTDESRQQFTDVVTVIVTPQPRTIVESTPVGMDCSMANVNGCPAIAFRAYTGNLNYMRALDQSGTTWNAPISVDTPNDTGHNPSLAVIDGLPAIAYRDATNGDLRFVLGDDPDGTVWNSPVTVANTGRIGTFGSRLLSLAQVSGNPAISYSFDGTPDQQRYVRANDAGGTVWAAPAIVDSNPSGQALTAIHNCLLVVNGAPAIAYMKALGSGPSDADLVYVRAGTATGANTADWPAGVTVDGGPPDVGAHISMAIVNGRPAIAYMEGPINGSGGMRYVRASDASGAAWDSPIVLVDGTNTGFYTSLTVVDGNPAVVCCSRHFGPPVPEVEYFHALDTNGASWDQPLILDTGSSSHNYTFASLLALPNGDPAVCYFDELEEILRYVSSF